MEDIVKNKKNSTFITKIIDLFKDDKKRKLYTFLFTLPFVVLIGVFGFLTYREAKNLIDLATGNEEVIDLYSIPSMGYKLRENATEKQAEYFAELKNAIEIESSSVEETIGLIGKNYVADFYTWTNKQGQYDVGGMMYVCSEKNELGEFRVNAYTKARDGYYKLINKYISEYGSENLLEVDNVEIVSCKKTDYQYYLHQYTGARLLDDGETVEAVYENVPYDCYDVKLTWTYKPESKLQASNFANSINLLVIDNDGKYEIAEASEKPIDAREIENEEE